MKLNLLIPCMMTILWINVATPVFGDQRSEAQATYAANLWAYITHDSPYQQWASAESVNVPTGPSASANTTTFLNKRAQADLNTHKAVIVREHAGATGENLAVTVFVKAAEGYSPENNDWYWAHFLPDGTVAKTSTDKGTHGRDGFVTIESDGRLWVFPEVSSDLVDFFAKGELAKHVIVPGVGPDGMTLKSADRETIQLFVAQKPGFFTHLVDGRLWVFKNGSAVLDEFLTSGEPAKSVTRPAAGPLGVTIRSGDSETITQYLCTQPGFVIHLVDGRLWVFRPDSKELPKFAVDRKLDKHVTRVGAGPGGITLKSPDVETLDAYQNAAGT